MHILWWILDFMVRTLIITFICTSIIDIIRMGAFVPKYYKEEKKSTLITKTNRIDFQKGYECSAYSCAYVLRHLGIEAGGTELYKEMPNKMKSGYVYPKGIVNLLSRYGVKCTYCKGNMNSLRHELNRGNPVIVLIRYRINKKWLHFVPVVGMNDEYIYVAESLEELVNCNDNESYNRRITIREFKKLWNTSMLKMPCYYNTYFSIHR